MKGNKLRSAIQNVLSGTCTAALALSLTASLAHGQDDIRGAPREANHFIGTPAGWTHPMTPWGEPDIQATLNMMQASRVPLERCANARSRYGAECDMDKAWLSDDEFTAQMVDFNNRVDRSTQLAEEGDYGAAIQAGVTDPNRPQRQTNLIVYPENGLLPALTAEGKRRAFAMKSDWSLPGEELYFDSAEDFDSWDRCITRGMPSSMMPYRYNGGFSIRQAPGYVILDLEMIHDARVIPTDGREAPASDIRQWMGVSQGYWDGETLVIETSNYKEGPPMINLAVVGSPPGNRFPVSDQMKTIERITRINDDWWLYEITTEDPVILTEPFTVRYPMHNDPSYWWSEYACHEDNTIVQNFTETSRYARTNPDPEPEIVPVPVAADVAADLAGTWVGQPELATVDYSIELEFTRYADGAVHGVLVGTDFGEIGKSLRNLAIDGRMVSFSMPNTSGWNFSGEIVNGNTLAGVLTSSQGGLKITMRPVD